MKRDLIVTPTAPVWELVPDVQPLRMLTAAELARMQSFPAPPHMTTESPPCAHFAIPQKSRIA